MDDGATQGTVASAARATSDSVSERNLVSVSSRPCQPERATYIKFDDRGSNTLHVSHPTRVNQRRRKRIACACVIAASLHHRRPRVVESA
jgi:hypothetical protein